MSDLPTILLLGGGGHCRSCIEIIESQGKYRIAGIVEHSREVRNPVLGYPVIGIDDDLPELRRTHHHALVTLGQIHNPAPRVRLFQRLLALDFVCPPILSPHAVLSPHASVGEGTIIMHNAVVNACAVVGRNVILNTQSLIEHDAVIADHCHISTAAVINGDATVGEQSFIGSNATVIHQATVPDQSFIRAASLFTSTHSAKNKIPGRSQQG